MEIKRCTRCGEEKTTDQFLKITRRGKPALSSWCRPCRTEAARESRRKNPEAYRQSDRRRYTARSKSPEYRAYQREYQKAYRQTEAGKAEVRNNRLRSYGLTAADYQRMFDDQDGKCAICNRRPDRPLHIDHCHSTGKVRALLCGPCNQGLGSLGDSRDRLEAAIKYLDRFHP